MLLLDLLNKKNKKAKYNPIIFGDSHDYLQYMAECGENIDGY